jgi:hypothetical protein
MVNFVNFDYYFLLKKFDSGIPERTFSYVPKFETIRGEYVLEDLKTSGSSPTRSRSTRTGRRFSPS